MQSQLENTVASTLYDEDFFAWARHSAELLRAGQLGQADIEHIAEEVEDMGRRHLLALESRVEVLLRHLLKWRFQPEKQSSSWSRTISVQRAGIERLLHRNPSLRRMLGPGLSEVYKQAVQIAAIETGLSKDRFPTHCPFTIEQILDPEFLP